MNIQFKPKDKGWPFDKKTSTNISDFWPDEIKGVGEDQEKEAQRLIDNGDFVATEDGPNSNEIAAAISKAAEKKAAPAPVKDSGKPK